MFPYMVNSFTYISLYYIIYIFINFFFGGEKGREGEKESSFQRSV